MSGSQVTHPLGEYAATKLGYKRIATVSDDFAYGHEHTAGFQRTFEENGGKIVQKLWPRLGAGPRPRVPRGMDRAPRPRGVVS
jgi:branched-chain amino acid transport system substrate-binding protein